MQWMDIFVLLCRKMKQSERWQSMKKITILTEPVQFYYKTRIAVKKMMVRGYKYGGHVAVTRSLIEGLDKIGYTDYNYRPIRESDIAEHVHVLAGVEILRYAIGLKERGCIKKLTAGPNVVIFSTDENSIISNQCIDLYLQPSQWTADFHIELNAAMENRCVAWPAGVDINKLKYKQNVKKRKQVLIYHKEESNQFCFRVDYLVRRHGYSTVIIKYGSYKFDEYIKILQESAFMVVIAGAESQGLYLAEAWAMDVPTICYESNYYKWQYGDCIKERIGNVSSCPYLTKDTGVTFKELGELDDIISNIDMVLEDVHPREWVVNNMTDEVCARRFLDTVME